MSALSKQKSSDSCRHTHSTTYITLLLAQPPYRNFWLITKQHLLSLERLTMCYDDYYSCCSLLLTLIFIFYIAWIFITERYETHLSEAQQRSHIYQHQISVNSSTSIQTVIFNGGNMSGSGDEVLAEMNGSESLSSILTRSSNGSQRQKTLSVSSAEEPLHIADVADLLHPQYAIITGGRSMDTGSPLITFPDHNNFHLLSDRDYQRLIQYLIGVTSLQDADLGFQLIIDRRKNSWASVKAVLVKISVSESQRKSAL